MSKTERRAELSEAELADLINATSHDDVLSLTFGGNRVWLMVDKASRPILQRLAELRGLDENAALSASSGRGK